MAGPPVSFMERALRAPDDDDFMMDVAPPLPNLVADPQVHEETQLQQLIRHWQNERHAPDILPGQEFILGALLDHIRRQVRRHLFPSGI